MRHAHSLGHTVLSIAPSAHGFGYALFEGPDRLIDWGAKQVSGDKNTQSLLRVATLLQLYQPRILVLEDYAGPGSRRSQRVQKLIDMIRALAKEKRVRAFQYPRATIRASLTMLDRPTKEEIARVITEQFPELQPWLPKRRRLWESEDYRMAIFDAVSLARTYYIEDAR